MKSKFWKHLFIFLGLGIGAVAVTSCQSVDPNDAAVVIDNPNVRIYEETSGGTPKRYATATIGVYNNSIYNVYTWDFDCTAIDENNVASSLQWEQAMYVAHGASGYVTLLQEVQDSTIKEVKINKVTRHQYANVWQTYLGWWIGGIAILAVSVIGFAIQVFTNRLTAEQTKTMFQEHTASMVTGLLFGLVICLFPLLFGSWVPALILSGSVLASFLLNMCITAIKGKLKNKE